MTKGLYIKTYGCQMNVYDSARMTDVLAPLGYVTVAHPEGADLVILNTCHIREKAAEKVYSELGRLRELREARRREGGPAMTIAVAGCVAQAEGREMLRRAPQVDLMFGPQTYHRLPELIARARRARAGTGFGTEGGNGPGHGVLDTEFPVESKFDHLPEPTAQRGPSVFLSIQEGCDKFCTFCVVPYTRGAEFSRPAGEVVAEAQGLVAAGAREITLLGQNVNAYHGASPDGTGNWGLGRLVRRLAEIEGLARLRYTTSHPRDMDEALIGAHGELDRLMPHLHLPVQSGADKILAAMNRRHSADDYRRVVERLRRARPDIAMSSDFIVGFPGETDRDFAETLRLVTDIGYAQAYSFKYSARPGTPASALEAQVPEDVKAERLASLQSLLDAQQEGVNQGSVGQAMPVLLERPGRRAGQLIGRSPYMQAVHLTAPAHLIGQIVTVRITAAGPNSLSGQLAGESAGPGAGAGTGLESDAERPGASVLEARP